MKKRSLNKIVFIAFCIVLNIVGSNIALLLHLPLYLDSIGTIMAAVVLGPLAGMEAGGLTGLIVGATTDLYSLFFLPVQLLLGLICGLLFRKVSAVKGKQNWWAAFVISLPGTLVSTLITVLLFHGITSSGSSILVQLLFGAGLSKAAAVFIIQILTDYLDRLLSLYVVTLVYKVSPNLLKRLT